MVKSKGAKKLPGKLAGGFFKPAPFAEGEGTMVHATPAPFQQ
jgi:hypothetical protein